MLNEAETASSKKTKEELLALLKKSGMTNPYQKVMSDYDTSVKEEVSLLDFIITEDADRDAEFEKVINKKIAEKLEVKKIEVADSIMESIPNSALTKTMNYLKIDPKSRSIVTRASLKMKKSNNNIMKLTPIERRALLNYYNTTSSAVETRPSLARASLNPQARKLMHMGESSE
jgi:hypothetical protein